MERNKIESERKLFRVINKRIRHKNKRSSIAANEVIGTMLLVLVAISSFVVINHNVLTGLQPPSEPPNVSIAGSIRQNNLILEHKGGESLRLDTAISLGMSFKNETFTVGDYLSADAIEDGTWDIGENVIYPLSYSIDNIQNYFATKYYVRDINSNSIIFWAVFDNYPTTDLGVTVHADNYHPTFGSIVNFSIKVTNKNGGTPAVNIDVLNQYSNVFLYQDSEATRGTFNPSTGIWSLDYLEMGESAYFNISLLLQVNTNPTQLSMILDGSSSIDNNEWNLMINGLANAIADSTVFPHDGSVELQVIQFGRRYWWWPYGKQYARIELEPIVVTKDNYLSIADQVQNINQLGGYTPMASGIYLAADTLKDSPFFNSTTRQAICLVSDGMPNCNCDPDSYTGYFVDDDYVTGRIASEQGRNYLIDTLNLSANQDQFVAIAVGEDANSMWLERNISWPKPSSFAPPYITNGWVQNVTSWQEFYDSIDEIVRQLWDSTFDYTVKINSAIPSKDPSSGNNIDIIVLTPGG